MGCPQNGAAVLERLKIGCICKAYTTEKKCPPIFPSSMSRTSSFAKFKGFHEEVRVVGADFFSASRNRLVDLLKKHGHTGIYIYIFSSCGQSELVARFGWPSFCGGPEP